jgi:FkbM family methyltransferase
MASTKLLDKIQYISQRVVEKFIIPRRKRIIAQHGRSPFRHKADKGLVFTIYPTEFVDQKIYIEGIYEKRFLDNLIGKFECGAIFLDIGANIGNHALYLHNEFAEIHCFEPNPETFRRLSENVAINQFKNIKLHQVALGDHNAVLPFSEMVTGNLGNSGFFIEDTSEVSYRVKELPVFEADGYVDGLNLARVDFIKIDVEGFELQVFKGLSKNIAKFRPIIAFEFHGQSALPGDFEKITSYLPGYKMYDLVYSPAYVSPMDRLKWNLRHGANAVLELINEPKSRTYENILAMPSDAVFRKFIGDVSLKT